LLIDLSEEYNTTFVVVTHDMSLSENTDIHYHLREGRLEEQ